MGAPYRNPAHRIAGGPDALRRTATREGQGPEELLGAALSTRVTSRGADPHCGTADARWLPTKDPLRMSVQPTYPISRPKETPTGYLRFGPFELDRETAELRRDGVLVKLQLQPARVLALLACRPGRLVTREEIRREVWPVDTSWTSSRP